MNISIIIPTRNAEQYMDKLLTKLNNQTIKPKEIITIDTASKDKTRQICEQFDNVKFIPIKDGEFDHGGTRNRAARQASGDILVFMTQDAIPEDEYFLEELIKPLGKNHICATYGRQVARKDAGPLEVFARKFNYPDEDVIKSSVDIEKLGVKAFFLSNVCSAFLANEFWNVDGFPEKTIMNEDMIIASKLLFNNKTVCYASKAKVIHSHSYTYIQQFKRNFDVGVVFVDSSHYFNGVKSESEGVKYVMQSAKYLMSNGKWYLIPHLIIDSGFRFLGYKAGKSYKKIPMKLVKKMSMHSFYFNNKQQDEVGAV